MIGSRFARGIRCDFTWREPRTGNAGFGRFGALAGAGGASSTMAAASIAETANRLVIPVPSRLGGRDPAGRRRGQPLPAARLGAQRPQPLWLRVGYARTS